MIYYLDTTCMNSSLFVWSLELSLQLEALVLPYMYLVFLGVPVASRQELCPSSATDGVCKCKNRRAWFSPGSLEDLDALLSAEYWSLHWIVFGLRRLKLRFLQATPVWQRRWSLRSTRGCLKSVDFTRLDTFGKKHSPARFKCLSCTEYPFSPKCTLRLWGRCRWWWK